MRLLTTQVEWSKKATPKNRLCDYSRDWEGSFKANDPKNRLCDYSLGTHHRDNTFLPKNRLCDYSQQY